MECFLLNIGHTNFPASFKGIGNVIFNPTGFLYGNKKTKN